MEAILARLDRLENLNLEILSRLTPKATRKFLPADEVADRLNRSAWTVRQLCAAGLIRAVKDNGTWRIPADEVARLETEGTPKLPRK